MRLPRSRIPNCDYASRNSHGKKQKQCGKQNFSVSFCFQLLSAISRTKRTASHFGRKTEVIAEKGKSQVTSVPQVGEGDIMRNRNPDKNRRDGCSPSRLFSDLRHVDSTAVLKA